MSLLTPPKTSHRDKENRPVQTGTRVSWAQQVQYRNISPLPHKTSPTKTRQNPSKSILKKPPQGSLPFMDVETREVTPEPQIPMLDVKYLENSVSTILDSNASLTALIEAYSILTARLRQCAGDGTNPSTSWPLFDPLRSNSQAFVASVVRDLGRALVDPVDGECADKLKPEMLPSPTRTPKKKRCMSAEQVKYARDLCTISLAVIRLLAIILASPPLFRIFTDKQLSSILLQVLAIPNAPELPTLNSRKTCALAIWLIQVQRLPHEVLLPASYSISYAIRRGIEGELGKEGKKGSVSDGLRAIHELLVFQPATFLPAFTEILPSVLSNLLSPSLNIRLLACHALGGFVLGCTSTPLSYSQTRIANTLSSFIKTTHTSPSKLSPSTLNEAPIVRTLRTTLNAAEFHHIASGPVWALSVLGSFVSLSSSLVFTDSKLSKVLMSLLSLAMRHKSSSVRGLGCILWRCVTWTYFQPPLLNEDGSNSVSPAALASGRDVWWNFVKSVVDMGIGFGILAGLSGSEPVSNGDLQRMFDVLKRMMGRNRQGFVDAMLCIKQLVSLETKDHGWQAKEFIPVSLFSAHPGLLTIDASDPQDLQQAIRSIMAECPHIASIRAFSAEELSSENTLQMILEIWKDGCGLHGNVETSDATVVAFTGILKAHMALNQDFTSESDASLGYAVGIIMSVLQDINSSWEAEPLASTPSPLDSPHKGSAGHDSDVASKLKLVRRLWSSLCDLMPQLRQLNAGLPLISCLMKNEADLTETGEEALSQWASLAAEVLVTLEKDVVLAFWGCEVYQEIPKWSWSWTDEQKHLVWTKFVRVWSADRTVNWESLIVFLTIPFAADTAWELDSDGSNLWEKLLKFGISKALDYGVDAVTFIDKVAENIFQRSDPTCMSSGFVVDTILNQVDICDARQVPDGLVEYVNETLRSSYPPRPQNKPSLSWMLRTLSNTIDKCPKELLWGLLEGIQEGLSIWILDEDQALPGTEYNDVLSLCETTIMSMTTLPKTAETVHTFSGIFDAIFYHCSSSPSSPTDTETFVNFWQLMFAKSVPQSEWPASVCAHFGITLDQSQSLGEEDVSTLDAETPLPELVTRVHSTPISSPVQSCPSTPPRASKSYRPFSPLSPVSVSNQAPKTPHSSPLTTTTYISSSGSPLSNKRRKLESNKENSAPHATVSTPNEVTKGSTKRRLSGGAEERSTKRVKVMPNPFSLDTETITISRPPTLRPLHRTTSETTKKKRLFLEAVEVPTVRSLYGKLSITETGKSRSSSKRKLDHEWDRCHQASGLPEDTRSGRPTHSPLARSLRRYQSLPSNLMGNVPPTPKSSPVSSDDDPHDGQVTPNHLISPAPQRVKLVVAQEDDLPSDDSDMTASPSREVIRRRLERTGSIERSYPLLA